MLLGKNWHNIIRKVGLKIYWQRARAELEWKEISKQKSDREREQESIRYSTHHFKNWFGNDVATEIPDKQGIVKFYFDTPEGSQVLFTATYNSGNTFVSPDGFPTIHAYGVGWEVFTATGCKVLVSGKDRSDLYKGCRDALAADRKNCTGDGTEKMGIA